VSTSDHDLSEFLLRVCHDLRTSLRAIGVHAELLRRQGLATQPSDLELRLGLIADGARRLDSLADGLCGYSVALQIEEGSFQMTGMSSVLRAAAAKLDKELREHGAELTSAELPRVFGDRDRLVQVFETLLANVLCHRGPTTPHIRIAAEKRANDWLFAVKDNGPGIDSASLEVIFKPFRRLHGSEPNRLGGMGLAICRAIVERHGGIVWAESSAGAGSTFFFTLPIVSE
jgi:light-regulated signal transduction histidine kinase (bacteriophytochrome)